MNSEQRKITLPIEVVYDALAGAENHMGERGAALAAARFAEAALDTLADELEVLWEAMSGEEPGLPTQKAINIVYRLERRARAMAVATRAIELARDEAPAAEVQQ